MNIRTRRKSFGLALMTLVMLFAMPSVAQQKVSLFNPFTLQSKDVIASDSNPFLSPADFLLLAGGTAPTGRLAGEGPRPTISLRGVEVRIPQRPSLRSAFSKTPFAADLW